MSRLALAADMTQHEWTTHLRERLRTNPHNVAIQMHLRKVEQQTPAEFQQHKESMFGAEKTALRADAAKAMVRELMR